MAEGFLKTWMQATQPDKADGDLLVLRERDGARATIVKALEDAALDHLANLKIIEDMGGYPEALEYVKNKLPSSVRVRSGDFGEILATEYIEQNMAYSVPVKRLRYKDDRNVAMRGDDVIALKRDDKTCRVLKAESKSRAKLTPKVVTQAANALLKHAARPNPSTLAFISSRLREQGRIEEAKFWEQLQKKAPKQKDIEHLIFTVSGNSPAKCLQKNGRTDKDPCRRHLVGCVVKDHQDFIRELFDTLYNGRSK